MTDKLDETKIGEPEVHAEKCPVCNSFGTLRYGQEICHACKGKGYILVPNKIERMNDEQQRLD